MPAPTRAPQRGDLVVAGRLRDLDGGDVARQRERAAQRDRPLRIRRRNCPGVHVCWLNSNDVGSSITTVAGVMSVRPSATACSNADEVDERLEDRARLTPRGDGAVVLRLVVGAAADEREHLAGPRVDGDERGLRALARAACASSSSTRASPSRTASCAIRCMCRSSVV